jgi:hypothetical protein
MTLRGTMRNARTHMLLVQLVAQQSPITDGWWFKPIWAYLPSSSTFESWTCGRPVPEVV